MDFTILICTYNREARLRELFSSFQKLHLPGSLSFEVVVVDNNSTDATKRVVQESAIAPRYLFEPRQGHCFALNTGVREARGEFVAFLDDDVALEKDYLVGLERARREHPDVNIFGGRVFPLWPYDPPRWITGGKPFRHSRGGIVAHDHGDEERLYEHGMRLPIGANFFCRRDLFERYGYYDVKLGPKGREIVAGGAETELLLRFQKHGERILYVPYVAVYHPVDPQRMTRAYFRKHLFDAGRMHVRNIEYGRARRVFGVPRYIFRQLATSALKFGLSCVRFKPADAYEYKLDCYYHLGALYEARRISLQQSR
ncbi:MAG TPA: glycosyltransferase [Candidatus Acidoferrales bacterium]|nr:glycosyltransferase [Candidatus Acidoferrales bacterium]